MRSPIDIADLPGGSELRNTLRARRRFGVAEGDVHPDEELVCRDLAVAGAVPGAPRRRNRWRGRRRGVGRRRDAPSQAAEAFGGRRGTVLKRQKEPRANCFFSTIQDCPRPRPEYATGLDPLDDRDDHIPLVIGSLSSPLVSARAQR